MNHFWHLSIWLSRAVLLFAIVNLGYPALHYAMAPVVMAATEGINLWTATSASITRVQFASYPVALLLATTYCLFSPRHFLVALALLCLASAVALCGYMIGVVLEGPSSRTNLFIERQSIATSIYLLGFVIEWQRRRYFATPAEMERQTGAPLGASGIHSA